MSTISQVGSDFNYLGSPGVALVSMGARNTIDGRRAWVMAYEGTQTGIDTFRATFPATGQEISVEFIPGGRSRMTVVYGDNPNGTETPVEDWSFEEIPTQPSIWTAPLVAPIIKTTPAKKKAIEDALASASPSNPYPTDPVLTSVFDLGLYGTEAWETHRPVIRKMRSYVGNAITRPTIEMTSTVYSRASLISSFSVPAMFQPVIPADPAWTASTNSTWGWRQGPRRVGYNRGTGRFEEEYLFEGNFWVNGLYDFV